MWDVRGKAKLTAKKIASLKAPGRYGDGDGLWLHIGPAGNRSWVLRYMRDGCAREMGLGPISLVSLAEARDAAIGARKALLNGTDPIQARHDQRNQRRVEAARGVSFKECAERYIATHQATWRNPKHRAQWRSTLATYAYPIFGDLPVTSIDTALVLKSLEPMWNEKPDTGKRLRGRIEAVLDWAAAREYRAPGDNPARWRGHLDKLLPAPTKVRPVKHHNALPFAELPKFMNELRDRTGTSARALELTILTAARTGEIIGAKWAEIDLNGKIWTVPGLRMKAGREHRVPLSERAVRVLKGLPREDDNAHVFIGGRKGAGLSNMAMLELMRDLRPQFVPHGFRSTFRDWASETTAYPNHVIEMALAHAVSDKVEAAYRRGDLFDKRRRLMADWSSYCAGPSATKSRKVIPIRGGRAK